MDNNTNKCYNVQEAASLLGITVRTMRQWIGTGKIAAIKSRTENRWMIDEAEIDRLKK